MKNPIIDVSGNKYWYNKQRELHRDDGPAWESARGSKYWYQNGVYHREDGPAWELVNGDKYWYKNGQLHRKDGPAIELSTGTKRWYIEGNETQEIWVNLNRALEKSQVNKPTEKVSPIGKIKLIFGKEI